MSQSCGTCNMSVFSLTKTGRFKKNEAGRCEYEIPVPALPSCVQEKDRAGYYKSYIWPNDGAECPVWAPRNA